MAKAIHSISITNDERWEKAQQIYKGQISQMLDDFILRLISTDVKNKSELEVELLKIQTDNLKKQIADLNVELSDKENKIKVSEDFERKQKEEQVKSDLERAKREGSCSMCGSTFTEKDHGGDIPHIKFKDKTALKFCLLCIQHRNREAIAMCEAEANKEGLKTLEGQNE